jgi:hypothetical protein
MTIVFPAHEALGDRLFRSFLTASRSNDLLQLAQCPLQIVLGEGYRGRPGTSVLAFCRKIVSIIMDHRYRPELYYMRGPGPNWFEKHGRLRSLD